MTCRLVIEQDAFMRMFVPMLDPTASQDYMAAVADFFAHDVPDFRGWLDGLRKVIPALFPAQVALAEDQDHFRTLLADADACIVESLSVGRKELAGAPRLAVVQKYGALTRNIDVVACVADGVQVSVQRRRVNVSLAELAFSMIAAFGRRLLELNHVIDKGRLEAAGYTIRPYDTRYTGGSNFARIPDLPMLQGKTLGIIGFGEVGRELARRARAFEMQVLYFQRTPLTPLEEGFHEARYAPLDELLAQSDFMSINLPVTPQTRNILGARELQAVKPGAVLVNVSRPELIDRAALFAALDSKRLAGYGTDTWFERPARADDPVFGYPNIIALPHTAIANRKYALADIADMFMKIDAAITQRGARA